MGGLCLRIGYSPTHYPILPMDRGWGVSLNTEKITISRHGNVPNETCSNFHFYKRYQPGLIIA